MLNSPNHYNWFGVGIWTNQCWMNGTHLSTVLVDQPPTTDTAFQAILISLGLNLFIGAWRLRFHVFSNYNIIWLRKEQISDEAVSLLRLFSFTSAQLSFTCMLTFKRMNKWMDEKDYKDGWMYKWIDRCMDWWIDGWIYGWTYSKLSQKTAGDLS